MPDDDARQSWYFCLRHKRVEDSATRCGSDLLMGPYESRDAAERYADTAAKRNDAWEAEDERWEAT